MAPEILLATTSRNAAEWATQIRAEGVELQVYPDEISDLAAVRYAVVLNQPEGILAQCPNLEAVSGLGHGVEYIAQEADSLPDHVQLFRIVDTKMAERMANWCLWAILNCQRKCDAYYRAQLERRWEHGRIEEYESVDNADFHVGIMGLGVLGGALAEALLRNGYPVSAWTRSRRTEPRFPCHAGRGELPAFLSCVNVLVCLMPITAETEGMLNADLLRLLPRGAYLINAGRGAIQVEADLVTALDEGQLAGVVLDVFEREPLEEESPLWTHPGVRVFPHVSSFTPRDAGVKQVLENWALVKAGKEVPPERHMQRQRGY